MNRIKLMQTLATALLTGALLAPAWAVSPPKAAEVTMGSMPCHGREPWL